MDKSEFYIFQEDLIRIRPYEKAMSISEIVGDLNNRFASENMKKLRIEIVVNYLIKKNFLYLDENNKKKPTQKGSILGISIKENINSNNEKYTCIIYNEKAQQFILDHLYEMIL